MDEGEATVRRYWQQVWCDGDATAPARLYAEGALMDGEPLDVSGFGESVAGWFRKFPDFTATVEDVWLAGDRVVTRVTYRGTHTATWAGLPATGRAFSGLGLDVFRVEDGRIAEHWHATDHYDMVVQLGGTVVPAAG